MSLLVVKPTSYEKKDLAAFFFAMTYAMNTTNLSPSIEHNKDSDSIEVIFADVSAQKKTEIIEAFELNNAMFEHSTQLPEVA